MSITSHRITRDLPGIGETDIDFNFTPGKPGRRFSADVDVLKATPVNGFKGDLTAGELRDVAQEDLDNGGYFFACQVASEERGER